MDPVTVAIVSALTKLGDTVVRDAYESLKGVLLRKAKGKPVVEAAEVLRQEATSTDRQRALRETIAASGMDHDTEVLAAAEALSERARAVPLDAGPIVQQNFTGNQNVVVGVGSAKVVVREK